MSNILKIERTGRILHLDGDSKYARKSARYYREMGLNAIVKNVPEATQPIIVKNLLSQFMPDILVITGHDVMFKKNRNYNDMHNYKNSKYFVNTVLMARQWEKENKHDITIIAGACESFFEAIMKSGADFASSPARILIDYIDPLVVAEKIAKTEENKYITIDEIANKLRDGINGIGGTREYGEKRGTNY